MTVEVNRKAVREILTGRQMRDTLLEAGWQVANEAAITAPRRSGLGAKSIRAELVVVNGEPEVRVSWGREAFWMGFIETGWENVPADPFLRAAAMRFR